MGEEERGGGGGGVTEEKSKQQNRRAATVVPDSPFRKPVCEVLFLAGHLPKKLSKLCVLDERGVQK